MSEPVREYPDIPRYQQFVTEMTALLVTGELEHANAALRHYRGRFGYDGPAVTVDRDDLQAVIRATSMTLQWDQFGKSGLVVYPA